MLWRDSLRSGLMLHKPGETNYQWRDNGETEVAEEREREICLIYREILWNFGVSEARV